MIPLDDFDASTGRDVQCSGALRKTGVRELSMVRVKVDGDKLSLEGIVGSFYMKQLATEAVRPHANGLQIRNRLEVTSSPAQS
ncbi:hypothetical protein K227x_30290 [Rubripirellula lacrimiformis]|uniref:BON domain protein n=1 Tax=Rubripirellula lacrimiformis TaxID=1930273 RepID=A0A517NBX4_9BACT|nr:BON domain-containing protein [Rubripirellula lacrimiformis]QDT04636.1 hypothetical protein K227x_30290 [Rubripirellula lacrimiformis]